jgi:hypothetical protein
MVVLDGNFALRRGLERITPKYVRYVSMYARTDRCYNERGSRTNYFRSSIPHCSFKGCYLMTHHLLSSLTV